MYQSNIQPELHIIIVSIYSIIFYLKSLAYPFGNYKPENTRFIVYFISTIMYGVLIGSYTFRSILYADYGESMIPYQSIAKILIRWMLPLQMLSVGYIYHQKQFSQSSIHNIFTWPLSWVSTLIVLTCLSEIFSYENLIGEILSLWKNPQIQFGAIMNILFITGYFLVSSVPALGVSTIGSILYFVIQGNLMNSHSNKCYDIDNVILPYISYIIIFSSLLGFCLDMILQRRYLNPPENIEFFNQVQSVFPKKVSFTS